jgi:hypothetical protein
LAKKSSASQSDFFESTLSGGVMLTSPTSESGSKELSVTFYEA